MVSIVIKIDSSSLSSPEKIEEIAKRVIEEKKRGRHVVVVVPNMELMDKQYEHYAHLLSDHPSKRELHAIESTNSLIASSLVAIAIKAQGFKAVSLAGWQAGVEVEEKNRNILIENINQTLIMDRLKNSEIVVVAGAQGVDRKGNILTIGEGGPETTAVAIAVGIGAELIEIFTVQDGIYTADPSVVKEAKKIKTITYDEMLELANLGGQIVHPRAVELAKTFEIPLVVRSSFGSHQGTLIKGEVDMEKNIIVRGVAYETDIIRLTVGYDSYEHASLANIFTTLANNNINVDIIVQAVIDGVKPTVSFSIAKEDFAEALKVLESNKKTLGFSFADFEVGLAKVSIVGSGMVSNPGVAARMFDRLRSENIQVKMVSTSEIKVSVVVPQDQMVQAANALHDEFNLVGELVN